MAVTEQVVVDVKSKYDDSGLKALRKSASESNNELSKLESTAGASISSFSALSATIGITLVASLGAFISKSITLGASLSELRGSFEGTSNDLELFRKATAGAVDEAGLIELSNKASDLGVTLDKQAQLFSLAEESADKYGGSLEENFQKVVNATDGSVRGLKAVGISSSEYKDKLEELTKSMNVNLDSLSEEEQMNIKLQAIFELTGTSIESVNNKTLSANDIFGLIIPTITDLASAFGEGLVNGISDSEMKIDTFSEKIKSIRDFIRDLTYTITKFAKFSSMLNLGDFATEMQSYMIMQDVQEEIDKLGEMQPSKQGFLDYQNRNKYRPSKTGSNTKQDIKEEKFKFDNEISKNSLEKLSQAVYDNLILMPLMRTFKIGTQPVGTVTQDPFKEWLDSFMNQPTDLYTVDGLDIESIYSDSQKVLSNVQSLFSMLDTGTDTFINKLLQFFGMIQKGFEAIGLIKSIVGIVTGGIGARPGINNSQSAIYIGMNVNTLELYRTGREQFNRLQNKTRVF